MHFLDRGSTSSLTLSLEKKKEDAVAASLAVINKHVLVLAPSIVQHIIAMHGLGDEGMKEPNAIES